MRPFKQPTAYFTAQSSPLSQWRIRRSIIYGSSLSSEMIPKPQCKGRRKRRQAWRPALSYRPKTALLNRSGRRKFPPHLHANMSKYNSLAMARSIKKLISYNHDLQALRTLHDLPRKCRPLERLTKGVLIGGMVVQTLFGEGHNILTCAADGGLD